jgi:hypothetical protein
MIRENNQLFLSLFINFISFLFAAATFKRVPHSFLPGIVQPYRSMQHLLGDSKFLPN